MPIFASSNNKTGGNGINSAYFFMKAIAIKNSYNAKESLKLAGFIFDSETKTWAKDFESKEEFDQWYNDRFTDVSKAGRRQSKFNAQVVFDFFEKPEEIVIEKKEKVTIPSKEETIKMIKSGEAKELKFKLDGHAVELNGYILTACGNNLDIREVGKISEEASRQVDAAIEIAAQMYICNQIDKLPKHYYHVRK